MGDPVGMVEGGNWKRTIDHCMFFYVLQEISGKL